MQNIVNAVEKYRNLILSAERHIWANPETGYKEFKTSAYIQERFEALGYSVTTAGNIPGFFTVVDTGRKGPTVLVLAELDAVICHTHPEADPETGAVHSCGHNAQCAAILGVAAALKDENVIKNLSGKIKLCLVPAEESIEMEYRAELRSKGIIKYTGGKSEFLSRGYFDDVDMAFMVHTGGAGKNGNAHICTGGGAVGFIGKTITYKGVAAHAGGAPWLGKNALYAANAGLSAVNALRETFNDNHRVRWHPIITHGGDIVNNIPEKVVIESMLRAASYEALETENKKINRALIGAAISFGVKIEIRDEPGYAPLHHDAKLSDAAREAFTRIEPLTSIPNRRLGDSGTSISGGTMDIGDLSMIMPVIHPYMGGSEGKGHGNDYYIVDPETACITSAEWQVAILTVLLENGAEKAKDIANSYKAPFASKEEFLKHQDDICKCCECVEYGDNGEIKIML